MKVPFVDLTTQHQALRSELIEAATDVIDRAAFILGDDVEAFELEFAGFQGAAHCVGVASGLDALTLSLRAIGVGPGTEVVIPANTFVATALAVSQLGARPVLADVDATTFNLATEGVERALTPRVNAVVPVHLYGQIADVDGIASLCLEENLTLVEDAAQAHGAQLEGRRAGAWGKAACFSFYPAKNLGACGDAGAIVTNDAFLADRLRVMRNYGSRVKYEHIECGYNSRLDSMQAAFLRVKLERMDSWNAARRRAAETYRERLGDTGVILPVEGAGRVHVYHLFVIRVADPRALQRYLAGHGVGTGCHYPIPVHQLEAYRSLGYRPGDFPVTEHLAATILSLPMYPEISVDQIDYVCDHIRRALGKGVTDPLAA